MARATRAAPAAVTRVRGRTIAPAASAVLVTALAVAVGGSLLVTAMSRGPSRRLTATDAVGSGARAAVAPAGAAESGDPLATVPDVPWLVDRGDGRWLFGRGAKARPLPLGEVGLAIDDRYLATSTPGADGRSTIHLRATATGARIIDIEAPIWVSAATWTPRGLIATGYRDASMSADGGLVLVTPTGSSTVLVSAGPFSSALGRPVARGDVVASASRQVVASNICGVKRCDAAVVDLTTGATFRAARPAEGFLRAVTDDLIVTTDDDARWISARRFGDGREVWRLADTVLMDPIATADGSVVGVVGSSKTGWGVDRIDALGTAHPLTPRVGVDAAWPRVWSQLSTPAAIVIGHTSFDEAVAAARAAPVDVIGIEPGRSATAARFLVSVGPETDR